MNTQEVASKLMALCREQTWLEAIDSLCADGIVSVRCTAAQLEGCSSHGTSLSCSSMSTSPTRRRGKRAKMPELGIYTVEDGRITREEFLPHAQSED